MFRTLLFDAMQNRMNDNVNGFLLFSRHGLYKLPEIASLFLFNFSSEITAKSTKIDNSNNDDL